jgi:hypothetical protein
MMLMQMATLLMISMLMIRLDWLYPTVIINKQRVHEHAHPTQSQIEAKTTMCVPDKQADGAAGGKGEGRGSITMMKMLPTTASVALLNCVKPGVYLGACLNRGMEADREDRQLQEVKR